MENNENNFEPIEKTDSEIKAEEKTENQTEEKVDSENKAEEIAVSDNRIEESKEKEGKSLWAEVFEWIQAIVVAVVIAMFLRTFVFTLVNVSGASMVPTLHDSDKLVVWRMGYTPKIGDVIIFRPRGHENTPYVKRVIATSGQTVDIKYNEQNKYCDVYVDNVKLEEKYIQDKIEKGHMGNIKYPVVVPENSVFAMGDNRNNSMDSRFSNVGMVSDESIIGHAVTRLWPLNNFGGLK